MSDAPSGSAPIEATANGADAADAAASGADVAAPAGEAAPDAHGKERSRRALLTTLSAVAGRGLGLVLSFISLPLTIGYLDKERYGLWITIGSFLAWLSLADLGLGNGLSNAVTAARAKGEHEEARRVISTAFMLLGAISLAMVVVFAVAFPFVPWASVFSVTSSVDRRELHLTIALCLAVFALSFPLGIVNRVLGACQEGYLANYWSSGSGVLSTVALILAIRFASGMPTLVVALSIVPLATRIATAVWVFTRLHPELRPRASAYRKDLAKSLLSTGGSFLVVQLAALGMWQNDNLVVAQLYGAAAVGPYSIAFRIASIYTSLANMWLVPLWPAYADAFARGDLAWIRASVRRTTKLALAATIGAAIGMMALGRWLILVWTRKADMVPSQRLLVPMAIFMVLVVFCQTQAMALNGLGRIRGQMYYGIAAAILNVGLSIVLGRWIGVDGVCWATCIAALIPAALAPIELQRALARMEAEQAAGASKNDAEASKDTAEAAKDTVTEGAA
ncbi:MAG: oligosaccharide flippase family protein [Minicystis sp.]